MTAKLLRAGPQIACAAALFAAGFQATHALLPCVDVGSGKPVAGGKIAPIQSDISAPKKPTKVAEKCSPFPEKDAATGKYGYRKDNAQWWQQPTYKLALPFHFGRAAVVLDQPEQTRKVGTDVERFTPCSYLRLDGTQLAMSFARCGPFTGGVAQVDGLDGSFGLIDRNGALLLPYVQLATWRHSTANVSEGLIALLDSDSGKIGYANEQGEWIIKPQFAQGFEHHEGLAAVTQKDGGKIGFIDRTGRVAIPFRYGSNFGEPPVFSEGLALMSRDNYFPLTNLDPPARLGFIDRKGAWKISPRYSSGNGFLGGMATVYQGEKEQVVDRAGKRVASKK